jgi:hypothetical protein
MSTNEAYDPNADGTYTEDASAPASRSLPPARGPLRRARHVVDVGEEQVRRYLPRDLAFELSEPDDNGDRTWT